MVSILRGSSAGRGRRAGFFAAFSFMATIAGCCGTGSASSSMSQTDASAVDGVHRTVTPLPGPDGFESDYQGFMSYFQSIRAGFEYRSIRRGIIIAEGNYIACQTWIEGRFVREFTHSPAGPLPSNGQRIVWDLQNIFRFDDQGRLVEEWVRTDYRSFLRQLATEART
jgi:predicted ester cyclase